MTHTRKALETKLLSVAVIFVMVATGFLVVMPLAEDIAPGIPDTFGLASAGDPLPDGPGRAHQDGWWGPGGNAGSGADVLLINTYMYYYARHNGYNGGWDSYYVATGTAVDDLHAAGYTVDTWYFSYYTQSYNPGRRILGQYDKANYYHNYYPVDSKYGPMDSYDDYKAVIIIGYGYYMFGYNYGGSYESAQPVTSQRAMTGLEAYADNGGSIHCACYYSGYAPLYYQYYLGNSAVQANMRPRLRNLFDVTTGTMTRNRAVSGSGYYTGYGARGMEGETPGGDPSIGIAHQDYPDFGYSEGDRIAYWYHRQPAAGQTYPTYPSIDRYPDQRSTYRTYVDYPYYYYIQYPVNDGIRAFESSSISYTSIRMNSGWRTQAPLNCAMVQSDHGGDFKTVIDFTNPWYGYGSYQTNSAYKYKCRVGPWATQPLMGSLMNFFDGGGGGPPKVSLAKLVEVSDAPAGNEYFEFYADKGDVDLSQYYLSVAQPDQLNPGNLIWDPANNIFNDQSDLSSYAPDGQDGWLHKGQFFTIDDKAVDSVGDQDNIPGNSMVGFFKVGTSSMAADAEGWGACGPGLNPIRVGGTSWSTQLYYDSGKYSTKGEWTIGPATKNALNTGLSKPSLGSSNVVINEIMPGSGGYIELYNSGNTPVTVGGTNPWWITAGDDQVKLSGSIAPGGFLPIYRGDRVSATRDNVALFNDLGTLVSQIGWNITPIADGKSIGQHLDGMATSVAYNDTTATIGDKWAKPVEANLRWDLNADPTEGVSNYDGIKTLVYHDDIKALLSNIDDGSLEKIYAGGVVKMAYDKVFIGNFDVVIMSDNAISGADSQILLNYLNDGGSLFMVCNDVNNGIASTSLKNMLGYAGVVDGAVPVSDLDVSFESLYGNMIGSGNVAESYNPGSDSYPVMTTPSEQVIMSYTVGDDAETSYRIIYTGLSLTSLNDDQITVEEFATEVMDWFTKDNIDHSPVVAIDDDLLDTGDEISLFSEFSESDRLDWANLDVDPWDQVRTAADPEAFEYMSFDVYISTNKGRVVNTALEAYAGTTDKSYFVPTLENAGHYYFTVVATDKYGMTSLESIDDGTQDRETGEFLFDNDNPVCEWVKPVFLDREEGTVVKVTIGDEIGSDPSPTKVSVYGKEYPGTPDYLALKLTDNYKLKMAGNGITEIEVSYSSTQGSPATGQDFHQLVLVGSNIYNKQLYNNMDARTVDMEDDPYGEKLALNEENELTVFIAPPVGFSNPDGSLPDGWYIISVLTRDAVRNVGMRNAVLQVDYNEPARAHSFDIGEKDYTNPIGDVYLQGGKANSINFQAQTLTEDPTLNLVELQMSQGTKNYNVVDNPNTEANEASNWVTFKQWETSDIGDIIGGIYNYGWTPTTQYDAVRAVTWDRAGNYNISEYFTDFIVDAADPYEPTNLEIDVDKGRVELRGRTKDKIGGSGISYVEVFLNDWDSPIRVEDIYNGGYDEKAGINPSGYFKVAFNLEAVGKYGADIRNAICVRAIDNVGNEGPLTEETDLPSIRVIKQAVSEYIPVTEQKPGKLTMEENEIREMAVTIITFKEGDNNAHTLKLIYHSGKPDNLPSSVVWLRGWWEVETGDLQTGGNFKAEVTVSYFLKQSTSIPETNLILVTRGSGSEPWENTNADQTINQAQGIHEFYLDDVRHFSDFAIIAGKANLYVEDVMLGRTSALKGQEMTISVTVGNEGLFAQRAGTDDKPVTAQVTLEYVNDKGNTVQSIIKDDLEFEPIAPGTTRTSQFTWLAPDDKDNTARKDYTVKVRVDRDNYVDESDENDNEFVTDLTVVLQPQSVSSLNLTPALMVVSLLAVLGMSYSLRRKANKKEEE